MNKAELAEKAADQYHQIHHHSEMRTTYLTKPLPPSRRRNAVRHWQLENQRDRNVRFHESAMKQCLREARLLYTEHREELYELAQKEETGYRFGEEIADLEETSPLNALGAKILQIGQIHIDRIDATPAEA